MKKQIKTTIKNFNFEGAWNLSKTLGNSHIYHPMPTTDNMKKTAKNILKTACKMAIENNTTSSCETGGFSAVATVKKGKIRFTALSFGKHSYSSD